MMDMIPHLLMGERVQRIVNMSHIINRVSFGPRFHGQVNPLDGEQAVAS